ncbi:MAG: hypothetical protein U9Q68_04070 [Euryarchaeota archaeon]|nr:hypothetical protein [Euryarchaeota archaeon]
MGRLYRAIEVASGDQHAYTVGFIDTGADKSVMSRRLADSMSMELKGCIEMVFGIRSSDIGATGRCGCENTSGWPDCGH